MDKPLALVLAALATTLALFFAGVFPYPFGLLILIALAIARLLQIAGGPR